MFQFSTTTVINNNLDNNTNFLGGEQKQGSHGLIPSFATAPAIVPKFKAIPLGSGAGQQPTGAAFWVARVGNFKIFPANNPKYPNSYTANGIWGQQGIENSIVYRNTSRAPQLAEATIDLSTLTTFAPGVLFRLEIILGLTSFSNQSEYARNFAYKGKPFFFEYYVKEGDTIDMMVASFASQINNFKDQVEYMWAKENAQVLNLSGVNEYQTFVKVALQQYMPDTQCCCDDSIIDVSTPNGVYKDLIYGILTKYAVQGFGNYDWMRRNIVLPTCANTDFFGLNQDEQPLQGSYYNQYHFRYISTRMGNAGNAGVVGSAATSITDHTFYVNNGTCIPVAVDDVACGTASAFETALTAAGLTITQEKWTPAVPASPIVLDGVRPYETLIF